MNFIETRGNDGEHPVAVGFSSAILNPMASFGGLYVPQELPRLGEEFLARHLDADYRRLARDLLATFELDIEQNVIDEALSLYNHFDDPANPVPVVQVRDDLFVSELYHGPTRAFKDMALQPFGVLLSHLARQRDEHYLILAATSGDTGPAALESFKDRPNVQVACLYPVGGTSDVQRLQMVTEDGANLRVIGVRGDFDDAQSALKLLLGSSSFRTKLKQQHIHLSAANSVNFGRIIFQLIYHIHSYLELVRRQAIELGDKVYLAIPSGNFGNALGGYYAWKMGLPVEKILIASNQNNVLTEFIRSGRYDLRKRAVVPTTSPAMDILKSSNIERLLYDLFGPSRTHSLMNQLDQERYYRLTADELVQMQQLFAADFCSDAQGRDYIKSAFASGYLMDTHTATCFRVYESGRDRPLKTIVCATAEWTKFSPTIANALTGEVDNHDLDALKSIATLARTPIPEMIQALFHKPEVQTRVVDKQAVEAAVLDFL
jgi:threonine synthase